jgi:purine-binding chemotaxis protein CheW
MEESKNVKDTYLSFVIGLEYFAVNVGKVLEVLERQTINQVPNAPTYIKGVLNFRGDIISVVESRVKFGLGNRPDDAKFVIIVLELFRGSETYMIGVMVDKVMDVLLIPTVQIKPVPKMENTTDTEFVDGVVQIDSKFIMLLNVDKIFSQNEISLANELSNIKSVI